MRKEKQEKKHVLTIFLLKKKYKKISDIIIPSGHVNEFSGLDGKAIAYLYLNNTKNPGWVKSFGDIFDLKNIKNRVNALIVYIEVKNRVFIFTTSFGHSKIKKDLLINDFGLKVVLNEVDEKALRSIDVRKLTLSSHQKREVSSSNSKLKDFEFDSDEDFLKSASGKLLDNKFAAQLSGSDSVKIVKRFNIKNISDLCSDLLVSYNKDGYKDKGFDFIDDLKKVYDSDAYLHMKKELVKVINKREGKKIILAYPEIEEYDFCNYKISLQSKNEFIDDINTDILFNFLDINGFDNLDQDGLGKIKIELLDEDEEIYKKPTVKRRYDLFDYLVFEFKKGKKKYIFINNQLYLVEDKYLKKLLRYIKKHEITNTDLSINLPLMRYKNGKNKKGKKCLKTETEGYYNERVEKMDKKSIFMFDKKLFNGLSKGTIEICDLLTKSREFIYVKIYKNSSAPLSHLFFQGSVSAELLANLQEYKDKIVNQTKGKFKINLKDRSKINFVFAVAIKRDGAVVDNLPIFSKISLRKTLMDIERMNFNAFLIKINFEKKETKNKKDLGIK